MKKEEIKTKMFNRHEYENPEFKSPSRFFILNALDQRIYFLTTSQKKAEIMNTEIYGKGFYKLRVEGNGTDKGGHTVRCTTSNLSRKGTTHARIKQNQGFGL